MLVELLLAIGYVVYKMEKEAENPYWNVQKELFSNGCVDVHILEKKGYNGIKLNYIWIQ